MTTVAQDQVEELKPLCESVAVAEEAGVTYVLLRALRLPSGCTPSVSDALLCPSPRDGYASRLYYPQQIATATSHNWNGSARILERNWHAFSWSTPEGQRLAQMVALHFKGLR